MIMIEKWMEVRYKKQSSGCCAIGKKVLQEDKNIFPLFPQNSDGKSSKMSTRTETSTGKPLRWAREEQVVWEKKDHWPKSRHRYWHRDGVNNQLVFFDRNVRYSSRWGPDPLQTLKYLMNLMAKLNDGAQNSPTSKTLLFTQWVFSVWMVEWIGTLWTRDRPLQIGET